MHEKQSIPHIYLNEIAPDTTGKISFNSEQIARYDIYGWDKKYTDDRRKPGIAGLILATLAETIVLFGVVVAALGGLPL